MNPPGQFPAMHATDIPNFEKLTDVDRVTPTEELLASVRKPDLSPPTVAHQLELERRWAEFQKNPGSVLTTE